MQEKIWDRSEGKGQTSQSWQEGDSNVNNHTVLQWYAEEHLWIHNTLNLEVDKLQKIAVEELISLKKNQ